MFSILQKIMKKAAVLAAGTSLLLVASNIQAEHADNTLKGSQGASGKPKADFVIPMNYELGMHCTGFEFAYCCVLPVYNSILAQVIKTEGSGMKQPLILEGDPNVGRELDVLARETVLRDPELDDNDNFKKYVLRYWHDAQPRNDGNGAPQSSTLISNVEGNSLLAWNTIADAADLNPDGSFKLSGRDGNPLYNGSRDVVLGNCAFGAPDCYDDVGATFGAPIDNYQNAVWNHLYIYVDTEGTGGNPGGEAPESTKLRLGLHVDYPTNVGPAGHPMGPVGSPLQNVLTFSEDTGTVVFTQMKVLEDLPITLTSPRIWEALGLPLTPFEDTINFFGDPGAIDEDSVRPYVEMKAQMFDYHTGDAVLDSKGDPVIAFGTAPIDIPNCERCHSELTGYNSAQRPGRNEDIMALVQQEMAFWNAYYPSMASGSDWYARLKGAAISILAIHDREHGTGFTDNYPGVDCANPGCTELTAPVGAGALLSAGDSRLIPQNTRLGHESVICQKCHADNVIAVVKSATCGPDQLTCSDGDLIPPLTEAIHYNHRSESEGGDIAFNDSFGRDGGCQGCHPAHRSDGDMEGYPITEDGSNFYANSDNRLANGGCFVGRDVHSNPMKDVDGAETPEHLNAMGAWLSANVFDHQGGGHDETRGIWCTNCHSQLSQEMWKAENMQNAILAEPGPGAINVRGGRVDPETDDVEAALDAVLANISVDPDLGRSWLDPKGNASGTSPAAILSADGVDRTHDIWAPDPGLCDYVAGYVGGSVPWEHDGNVAVVEVVIGGSLGGGGSCTNAGSANAVAVPVDCGFVTFDICGSTDSDGDFNVNLVGNTQPNAGPFGGAFCTTPDCVTSAQATLPTGCGPAPGDNCAVPVPFSAASDGRDHWLSAGEPHCADCHAAPYVEQSGNIDAFAPFNYPRKSSLMRYSRGHQDITCQGCHESIHGLYPVTPLIDTTSYAQAAQWNTDDSHGPLKCGACHTTNAVGVNGAAKIAYTDPNTGVTIPDVRHDFDAAVSWMHTYTDDADPRESLCLRCHGEKDDDPNDGQPWDLMTVDNKNWAAHAQQQRVSRKTMDKAEIATLGHVLDTTDGSDGICLACHKDKSGKNDIASCGTKWKKHLVEGRVSEEVWEHVTELKAGFDPEGTLCGW